MLLIYILNKNLIYFFLKLHKIVEVYNSLYYRVIYQYFFQNTLKLAAHIAFEDCKTA